MFKTGYLENLSTEQLEAMDEEITLSMRALGSWNNRALSYIKRLQTIEMLREKQKPIMAELIKRAKAA